MVGVSVLLGVASVWACLADPVHLAPRSNFAAGHVLAISLGQAAARDGHFFATSTALVGWPDQPDFRPLMWPMQLLGLVTPAILAYTLAFLVTPLFNALGGYALGRAWGRDPLPSAALGLLLAWHPWVRETLTNGQIEQSGLGGIALVWAAAAWAQRGPWASVVAPGVLIGLLALAAPHLGLTASVGLALFALTEPRAWRRWLPILAFGAAGALLAAGYHAPNFSDNVQVFWPKGSPGQPTHLAGLPEESTLRTLFLAPPPLTAETLHPSYLGWVWLLAAFASARGSTAAHRVAAGLFVAFAFVLLAFGRQIGPLPGLFRLLELGSDTIAQSQSPYRMTAGAVVVLALLGSRVLVSWPRVALVVALAWAETSLVATRPFPFPAQHFDVDSETAGFREGSGSILDLPVIGPKCPDAGVHYSLQAAWRSRPTPVLMSAPAPYPTLPAFHRQLIEAWQEKPCGPALGEAIRRRGFTGVVLHTHLTGCPVQPSFARCLEEAFGPPEESAGLKWWDPIPDPRPPTPRTEPAAAGPAGPTAPVGAPPRAPP